MGGTLYTFNGGGTTGTWNTPTTWTTDPTGSTSVNPRLPVAGDVLVVTNSFVVTLDADVTLPSLAVTIQRGGVLDMSTRRFTGTLDSLSGRGTLRIGTPTFPTVTTNNFDDANTGTVEFYNWSAGNSTLPTTVTQYNNLRLLNTTSTAFTALLGNNLTVNGSLTLTRTNATAFPDSKTAPLATYANAAAAAAGAGVSLKFGNDATGRTLNVYGTLNVGAGTFVGVNNANNGTHVLNAYGDFLNNGTVNLRNGTDAQVAQLYFRGATEATFTTNGDTDIDILTVDKGIDSQVLLNVVGDAGLRGNAQGNLRMNHTSNGQILTLTNGVTKIGNNIYLARIHNGSAENDPANVSDSGWWQLGSSSTSPTLWIAGGTVINDNASLFAIYGTYRISAGSLSSVTTDAMVVREDGQVLIEGGTTSVNKYRPSSTSSTHRGSFIITGGLFQCLGTVPRLGNDQFARFSIPYLTQSFRMTGGTLRVQNPNPNGIDGLFHIGVNPNNAIVSGGTIELRLPNSDIDGKILTTSPLWNLTITKPVSGGQSEAVLASVAVPTAYTGGATTQPQPLTVLNDFTISTNAATFNAAGQNVTIAGSFTIGSGSAYLPGTNTTTFNGSKDQLLTVDGLIGATASTATFSTWTVNKPAGTLTLAGAVNAYSVPTGASLNILQGVLNDAGKTISVQGGLFNSAFHQSVGSGSITLNGTTAQTIGGDGTGVFGNLRINVPTASIAAGTVAVSLGANISVSNVLTLASQHILSIGAYRLALTNISPNAIGPVGSFSNLRMVQTAGNASDLGIQKTYGPGTAQSFIFPVGTGTKFTPATVTVNVVGAFDKFGQVSVSPANIRNPFATGSNNALRYYWKVRSINFGPIPAGSIDMTFRMLNADAASVTTSYVGGRYLPITWNTAFSTNISGFDANSSDITFTGMERLDGEFTAGNSATAFGAVTAFYSRTSGPWNTNTTWSTSSNTGAAVPAGTTAGTNFPGSGNPVFIGLANTVANGTSITHTVTVPAEGARAGSLVIDRGSVLDVGTTGRTTAHNFGALPDSKVGGSGRLRISSSNATAIFPGGDFGSFIQAGGGTVEYYSTGTAFALPTASGSLTLNQYRNLWLNAGNSTITLPAQDLRIHAQLRSGSSNGTGLVLLNNTAAGGNLRIDSLLYVQAGTLRYPNAVARALAVDTDVRVDAGATFDVATAGTAVANTLTVGGSVTNNGTFDLEDINNSTVRRVGLTFTGSANSSLTGTTAGALTDLRTLTLNKGTGRASTLTIDVAGTLTTPANNWLTLTNGTLRFAKTDGSLIIHDGVTTPYLITDNAGLTVDGSNAVVTVATGNSSTSDLRLAGELRVLQGTLRVGATGNTAGNDLEYASAGAPTLRVAAGGTLYVNGQLRRTVANLDGALRYVQTGGTVDIDGRGATALQNNERGLFEVQGPGSIFRMTAGSLNLHRSNKKSPITTADLYLAPDSTAVTGGTVRLGNAAAGVGNVIISVNATVPLYDMVVETGANDTNTNTGLLAGTNALNLKGSLTIGEAANTTAFFNANGYPLNIDQNLVNNNTSTSTTLAVITPATATVSGAGFQPATAAQTTTFTGKGPAPTQLLTSAAGNLTLFGGLVQNNAQPNGTLQLGGNARVSGILTLTQGILNDNGNTLTAVGQVLNSATHTSPLAGGALVLGGTTNQAVGGNGQGKFGNLTLNNPAGATTTANQEVTRVLALNGGVLFIGSNLLNLSNTGAAVTTTGTFDNTRAIRTNGIVADLGVRKSYAAGASSFTFPVGSAVVTKYTPVQVALTSNTAAGTITVQPIDIAHPSTTDAGNKELSYYWKLSTTGLAGALANLTFTYAGTDVNGTASAYRLGRFRSGQWNPQGGLNAAVNTTLNTIAFNGVGLIDGDYTGGEASEFGAVPTFYSRNATAGAGGANWTDLTAWTSTPDGSGPATTELPTLANPVVILPGHRINAAAAGRGAASLVLDGTLDLGTNLANNFSTVSGTGTLRIGTAIFPAGNYARFVAANGGTVEFTGAVQLPARDLYNNLTLSGGTPKQLTNLDLTINGTLNIAANTTVDNPTSQTLTLTSATAGATVAGTLNLNDGPLTTAAFVTTTPSGTLTLGAGALRVGTVLTNGGTLVPGTAPLSVGTAFVNNGTYNAAGPASTGSLAVAGSFTNAGLYAAGTGRLDVAGTLTNASTGTLEAAVGDVNVEGSFVNGGAYRATAINVLRVNGEFSNLAGTGTVDAGGSTLILRGSFTNRNGAGFYANSSLVQFLTNGNQFVNGNTSFFNLQKLGGSALTLGTATDVRVGGLLTIQNSVIFTGTPGNLNTLYLDNTAVQPIVGNTLTSYVVGRLAMALPNDAGAIRVFPVGAGQRYRPVTIKPLGTSNLPVVLVEIINGAAPNANAVGNVDATLQNIATTRYYRIQLLSGTLVQPTVQLSFNTDVEDETINVPGNLRVARSNGPNGVWGTAGGSGVYSPDAPRGYTTSAATTIDNNSFFVLASTNKVDNPLSAEPGKAPLPVALTAFGATRQGSAVQVAWATASEQRSAYFEVERSADGRAFAAVARVAAQGTSTARRTYGSLDRAPLPGTSYYRLRQVDQDGTATYSAVATVRFDGPAAAPALLAYPNPATGRGFGLAATHLAPANGTVRVVDNVGRLVFSQQVAAGTTEMQVQPRQPLASGLYFATWISADGTRLSTKVTVE